MKKKQIIDFLIIIFAFLFIGFFPYEIIFNIKTKLGIWLYIITYIVVNILFLIFLFIFSKKSTLKINKQKTNFKIASLFIPAFVICGSNYLYLLTNPSDFSANFEVTFFIYFVFTIFTALKEEFIFRVLLITNLDSVKKPLNKILISSGIFAFMHIFNFFSSFNPYYLLQIVYTFGLGLVLGLIYYYSNSFIMCFSLHFLFNVFNDDLYRYLVVENSPTNLGLFILVNCGIALIVGIYLLFIYLFKLRKTISSNDIV